MGHFLKIFLVIILFVNTAIAEPFLINDPPEPCGNSGQLACPESTDIFIDGVPVATNVVLQIDMSIKYDLLTMPIGEHSYAAKYNYSVGRQSDLSDPYLFLEIGRSPLNLKAMSQP